MHVSFLRRRIYCWLNWAIGSLWKTYFALSLRNLLVPGVVISYKRNIPQCAHVWAGQELKTHTHTHTKPSCQDWKSVTADLKLKRQREWVQRADLTQPSTADLLRWLASGLTASLQKGKRGMESQDWHGTLLSLIHISEPTRLWHILEGVRLLGSSWVDVEQCPMPVLAFHPTFPFL